MEDNRMVRTAIGITKEQHEWLKENGQINFSGFVRQKLDELIARG